jgi:hypothetical protein
VEVDETTATSVATPIYYATTDDAISIYQRKFPKKENRKRAAFIPVSLGVPQIDIDGTRLRAADNTEMFQSTTIGTTFSERDDDALRATYHELVNVYGESAAYQMVKDLPICLAFDRKHFAPTLVEFGKKFGIDESRAMIQRNPGLLAVKPTGSGGADTASDQTMIFSYLVAITRPLGPVLLPATIFLTIEPFVEQATGIHLHDAIANIFQ